MRVAGARAASAMRAAVLIAACLIAFLFAKHDFATNYQPYDDEGYMLLSINNYLSGGHLYTDVYSEYGPFNFLAESALFRMLAQPVNHDSGRLVAFILLMISAILAGYFAYRIFGSHVLAAAAGLAVIYFCHVMSSEPGHPQQLILPLFMLACCVSVLRWSPPVKFVVLGVIGAALSLIKINVGVFYFAALACTLICGFTGGVIRKIGTALLLVYAVAGPLVLMRAHLGSWAADYALMAVFCTFTTFYIASVTVPVSVPSWRNILYATGGALAAGVLIVAATLSQGMSPQVFLEGVLWDPLKHPSVFTIPLQISKAKTFEGLVVSAGLIWLFYWWRRRGNAADDRIDALKCMAGLCALASLIGGVWKLPSVVAFLPILLFPVEGMAWEAGELLPRLFVTTLAVTQFLQPYPVAGSHLAISATPVALWGFLCIHDGAAGLARLLSPRINRAAVGQAMGWTLVFAVVLLMWRLGGVSIEYQFPASRLAGAASLHLKPEVEDRFEYLVDNVRANCDFLFSMPLLGSLNFWSGVPPANGLNLPGWTRAFSPAQQQQILDRFQADPRGCAIYNQKYTEFRGTTVQDLSTIPLARYILYEMKQVVERDGYQIRVTPSRRSPWIKIQVHARAAGLVDAAMKTPPHGVE